jgi:hypothetical protein
MSLLEENEIISIFDNLKYYECKERVFIETLKYIIVYKLLMQKIFSYDCG